MANWKTTNNLQSSSTTEFINIKTGKWFCSFEPAFKTTLTYVTLSYIPERLIKQVKKG